MDFSSLLHCRECPICYEPFSTAHIPLKFPCAHRLCSVCVPLIQEEEAEEEDEEMEIAEIIFVLRDDGHGHSTTLSVPIWRAVIPSPTSSPSPTIRCPLCRDAARRVEIEEDRKFLDYILTAPSPKKNSMARAFNNVSASISAFFTAFRDKICK